jgi:hypothetical protein
MRLTCHSLKTLAQWGSEEVPGIADELKVCKLADSGHFCGYNVINYLGAQFFDIGSRLYSYSSDREQYRTTMAFKRIEKISNRCGGETIHVGRSDRVVKILRIEARNLNRKLCFPEMEMFKAAATCETCSVGICLWSAPRILLKTV